MNLQSNINSTYKTILWTVYLILLISCGTLIKILDILTSHNKVYNTKKIFFSHSVFIVLGLCIIHKLLTFNEKKFKRLMLVLFFITFLLLIAVLILGNPINGTKRWLTFLGFSMQPSYFFLMIFPYINSLLFFKQQYKKSIILLIIILILLMMQPDFGSSLLLVTIWGSHVFFFDQWQYFKKYLLMIGGMFVTFLIFKGIYALKRIQFIFKPTDEINQTNLALKAIKFSNLFGSKKIIYIPEMHNDYFFSSFINIYGFIPILILLIIWFFLFFQMIEAIDYQKHKHYQGMIMGSVSFLIGQFCLHVFTNINLIPAKGISLPLISAGGSLLIANLFNIGIILYGLKYQNKL